MTKRIPRGWAVATERGEGVWCDYAGHGWRKAITRGPLLPERTYIRRTDPTVPADPNECLRLEDEAARLVDELPQIPVSDRPNDAEQMVPGMMRLASGVHLPVASLTWGRARDGSGTWVAPAEWEHESTTLHDSLTPPEFAAAYTAAWEYTERRRAEIAEEVRRGGAPSSEPAVSPLLADADTLRERTRRRDAATEPPPEGEWVLSAGDSGSHSVVQYLESGAYNYRDRQGYPINVRWWWPLPEVGE